MDPWSMYDLPCRTSHPHSYWIQPSDARPYVYTYLAVVMGALRGHGGQGTREMGTTPNRRAAAVAPHGEILQQAF
ncbi:replication factor A 1, Rfa1 [Aspergillus luchuensis]|uniref:Replication factor A 1, Rfa1 n=1 Tax=Aspergillus kawachii TaxID=1069201 RepID=A0A146F7K8_ASPKA|nr:replication factor A 1, Rfa1 [Aspergillus luchuensis]